MTTLLFWVFLACGGEDLKEQEPLPPESEDIAEDSDKEPTLMLRKEVYEFKWIGTFGFKSEPPQSAVEGNRGWSVLFKCKDGSYDHAYYPYKKKACPHDDVNKIVWVFLYTEESEKEED